MHTLRCPNCKNLPVISIENSELISSNDYYTVHCEICEANHIAEPIYFSGYDAKTVLRDWNYYVYETLTEREENKDGTN